MVVIFPEEGVQVSFLRKGEPFPGEANGPWRQMQLSDYCFEYDRTDRFWIVKNRSSNPYVALDFFRRSTGATSASLSSFEDHSNDTAPIIKIFDPEEVLVLRLRGIV